VVRMDKLLVEAIYYALNRVQTTPLEITNFITLTAVEDPVSGYYKKDAKYWE